MNFGPFIFLGAFVTFMISWATLVVAPQVQLRSLDQTRDEITGVYKPAAPMGAALQGASVYRANACNYCHSQQVQQTGYEFDIMMEVDGSFPEILARTLVDEVNPKWSMEEATEFANNGGMLFEDIGLHTRDVFLKKLDDAKVADFGGKVSFTFNPTGPDIERGWGPRATVAADYLFDEPAMIGQSRIGPDLANVGSRLPDEQWHYLHLYAPDRMVEGSTMPAYRYLFEKRAIGDEPSPDALALEGDHAPESGFEIVPTEEARMLVAYLKSLRITDSLPTAPMQTE